MKWKWIGITGAVLLSGGAVALVEIRGHAAGRHTVDTPRRKLSYAMGVAMARNLQGTPGVELDQEVMERGLRDGLSGGALLVPEDDLRAAVSAYQSDLKQKQADYLRAAAESNREEGAAFLARNAKEPGVVSLPSGLQVQVLAAGNGDRPMDADTVECRYRSTRIDGREVQSSDPNGKPLQVAAVIPGLKEALKLMPVGAKWKLFVPPHLAYRERGLPDKKSPARAIGPNETLIFEVELLAIKPAAGGSVEVARSLPGRQGR